MWLLLECAQALFSNWSRQCISQLQRANLNQFNIILISSSIHAPAPHLAIFFLSISAASIFRCTYFRVCCAQQQPNNGRTAQQLLELRCHSFAHRYFIHRNYNPCTAWFDYAKSIITKKKTTTLDVLMKWNRLNGLGCCVIATGVFFSFMPLLFFFFSKTHHIIYKWKTIRCDRNTFNWFLKKITCFYQFSFELKHISFVSVFHIFSLYSIFYTLQENKIWMVPWISSLLW